MLFFLLNNYALSEIQKGGKNMEDDSHAKFIAGIMQGILIIEILLKITTGHALLLDLLLGQ